MAHNAAVRLFPFFSLKYTPMKRQTILLFAAFLLILPMQAQAAKKVHWKLATTWSSTLKPLANSGPQLAKMVEDMTGGNFIIRVVGAEKSVEYNNFAFGFEVKFSGFVG